MCMTDPLADMFTRIVNGQGAGKFDVQMPVSKVKLAVSQVLKNEGYINDFKIIDIDGKSVIRIILKYFNDEPVINKLKRVSRPGRRIYKSKDEIPHVIGGLGISVITTSSGVMTDREARKLGLGGEVLCLIS
jgi:small subunit ribosomal protein S8